MSLIRKYAIGDVLPHAGAMLLLDELLDYGPEHVDCAVTIRNESLFCEAAKGMPAWVGVEYMAQTAGTFAGIADVQAGRAPGVCLLLGARSYRAETAYFPIGARLRIAARLALLDENDLAAFDCVIYSEQDEKIMARGDIKAYRPKDLAAVVRGERI